MNYDYGDVLQTARRITGWMQRWGVVFDAEDALHDALANLLRQGHGAEVGAGWVVRETFYAARRALERDKRQQGLPRRADADCPGARAVEGLAGRVDVEREVIVHDELGRALAFLARDPDGPILLALAEGYTVRELGQSWANLAGRGEAARGRLLAHLGYAALAEVPSDLARASRTRGWREAAKDRARARHTREVAA